MSLKDRVTFTTIMIDAQLFFRPHVLPHIEHNVLLRHQHIPHTEISLSHLRRTVILTDHILMQTERL